MKLPYCKFFLFILFTACIISCEKDLFEKDFGTFIDARDNHEYKWVRIGNQIWMAGNLAYAPTVCGPTADCGIYVYDYQGTGPYAENYVLYGCLYNWETAQKVCPDGWHLPSDEEWIELEQFLGMPFKELDREWDLRGENENVGGKLKETAFTHWNNPNAGATDEVGFCALPGGGSYDRFVGIHNDAEFWTASQRDNENAMYRALSASEKGIYRFYGSKSYRLSIRCIKN
ncbi:MAG: fibrobacter succinogenes major paralogous domain-containing protein [Bacteroidota bacterium]|nr:fibrobacter succinogenes major paralogous domain-containing protein [Bacteroidota bacterium]